MAIQLPNGKISRTLPEQVGFNSKKIEEIIKAINDFELQDKVINLGEPSGTLSDSQFATAELSPSYIVYDGKVFIKAIEDSTYIDFIEVGAIAGGSISLTLSVERVRITISSKAYQYATVQLFESYTKDQIDTLISGLESVYAKLSGANFTGSITAPEIRETMTGYSFKTNTTPPAALTLEYIFAGVVKNGNKLTFVIALNAEATASILNTVVVGTFTIPAEVHDKLFPTTIGNNDYLDAKPVHAMENASSGVQVFTRVSKSSSNRVTFEVRFDSSVFLTNTNRYIRIEETFLLSDNLIP